jgi:hypothetical protein
MGRISIQLFCIQPQRGLPCIALSYPKNEKAPAERPVDWAVSHGSLLWSSDLFCSIFYTRLGSSGAKCRAIIRIPGLSTLLELCLPTQIQIPFAVHLPEEVVIQVVNEIDGFARRFHFGAQLFVHVRELGKRKHRHLDRIADFLR